MNLTSAVALHRHKSTERFFERILFVSCPTGTYCREDRCQSYFSFELVPSMRPPLEECEAAGAITNCGSLHNIIDAPAEKLSDESLISRVRAFGPDLIILSVTFGSIEEDLKWAVRLKDLVPDSKIGLRGAPCYVWAEDILKENPAVDLCVCGDYELVFRDLITRGIDNASGVISRSSDARFLVNPPPFEENLDLLPLPDRSKINSKLYTVRVFGRPQATVRVQRGCPFPCTYCLVHTVSGNKARHRSPDSIADEIQSLQRSGIDHFYLRAETFTLDRTWAIEVGKTLAKRCPGIRWVTTTRVECVDEEVLEAMQLGGCYAISFGIDVASEKIGRLVKKRPNLELSQRALRACDNKGILSLVYLMVGFVWDDQETLRETAKFAHNLRPDLLTIHYAHPYPGTPYYNAVKESKLPIVSLRAQSYPAIEPEGLSIKELNRFTRRLLFRHYTRPSVLWSLGRKIGRFIVN